MLLTAIREIKGSNIQSIIHNTAEAEDNTSITSLVSGIILGDAFKRMVELPQGRSILKNNRVINDTNWSSCPISLQSKG